MIHTVNRSFKLNGVDFKPVDLVIDTKLGELYNVAIFKVETPPNLDDTVEFQIGDFSCYGFVHKIVEMKELYEIEARSYGAKLSKPYSKSMKSFFNSHGLSNLLNEISTMIESKMPEYHTYGAFVRDGTLSDAVRDLVSFMKPDIYANKDKIIIYPRRGADGEPYKKLSRGDIIDDLKIDIVKNGEKAGSVCVVDGDDNYGDQSDFGFSGWDKPRFSLKIEDGKAYVIIDDDCFDGIDGVEYIRVDDFVEVVETKNISSGSIYVSTDMSVHFNGQDGGKAVSQNGKTIPLFYSGMGTNVLKSTNPIPGGVYKIHYKVRVFNMPVIYTDGKAKVTVFNKCGDNLIEEDEVIEDKEVCNIELPYTLEVNISEVFGVDDGRYKSVVASGIVSGTYTSDGNGILKIQIDETGYFTIELDDKIVSYEVKTND